MWQINETKMQAKEQIHSCHIPQFKTGTLIWDFLKVLLSVEYKSIQPLRHTVSTKGTISNKYRHTTHEHTTTHHTQGFSHFRQYLSSLSVAGFAPQYMSAENGKHKHLGKAMNQNSEYCIPGTF